MRDLVLRSAGDLERRIARQRPCRRRGGDRRTRRRGGPLAERQPHRSDDHRRRCELGGETVHAGRCGERGLPEGEARRQRSQHGHPDDEQRSPARERGDGDRHGPEDGGHGPVLARAGAAPCEPDEQQHGGADRGDRPERPPPGLAPKLRDDGSRRPLGRAHGQRRGLAARDERLQPLRLPQRAGAPGAAVRVRPRGDARWIVGSERGQARRIGPQAIAVDHDGSSVTRSASALRSCP